MMVDFPQLKEFDINPLFIDENQAFALDARGVINKERLDAKPHENLVISPYPEKYVSLWKLRDGRTVMLRPIKPEDESLWLEMFHNFSQESLHFRLFQTIVQPAHEYSARYCNIDYDRELAIVAEIEENGKRKMLGVVRLNLAPPEKTGEISFIVTDTMQGQGLGSKMVDYMIEISKDKKLETINAIMLPDNYKAIKLLWEMGFTVESMDDGTQRALLELT
jgi:acetyltransferase